MPAPPSGLSASSLSGFGVLSWSWTGNADGYNVYQQALQGQSQAISGVSLDEEAVQMLQYQRAYQASAKYIATLNSLLEVLVQL